MAWQLIRQNADGSILQINTATGKTRTLANNSSPKNGVGMSTTQGAVYYNPQTSSYHSGSTGQAINKPQAPEPSKDRNLGGSDGIPERDWSNSANWGFEKDGRWFQKPEDYYNWRDQQNRKSQGPSNAEIAKQFSTQQKPNVSFSSMISGLFDKITPDVYADNGQSVPIPSLSQPSNLFRDISGIGSAFNPSSGLDFGQRLKEVAGGITGLVGNQVSPYFDLGLSEKIRGLGARPTAISGESSGGDLFTKKTNNLYMPNDGSISNTQKNAQDLQRDITKYNDALKTTVQDSGLTGVEGIGQDFFALDAGLENTRQNIISNLEQGRISQEEGIAQYRDAESQRLEQYYKKLNEIAQSNIPELKTMAEEALAKVGTNLDKFNRLANETKDDLTNTFGGNVRTIYENANAAKNRLRNVSSAMGSSESSQFLENLANIERLTGKEAAQNQFELGKRTSNIDQQVLDATAQASEDKKNIMRVRDQDIKSIMDRVDLNNLEKANKIGDIMAQAQQAVIDLQSGITGQKNQLQLLDRQALIDRSNLLAQGQIDQSLINSQYDLQSGIQNSIPSMPPELNQELQMFMSAPYSGVSKKNVLKSKYPQWADIIDGVFSGQITDPTQLTVPLLSQNQSMMQSPLVS